MTKKQKKTIINWKKLILPETEETSKIDAQKILLELRYRGGKCS